MQKKLFIALAAIGTMTLVGCKPATPGPVVYPPLDPELSGQYVADFSQGKAQEVFASDGWTNGSPFNAVWKKNNISYVDGKMKLAIKEEQTGILDEEGNPIPYTAGEARTHKLYGYGDYIVSMKPSNVPGSVSTFFTYTGSGTFTDGEENNWNEIDIEFLGSDTTKVQFNYYQNGSNQGHEYMYDLGFDASQAFHTYGFRWEEDKISWVVDGKTAYQVTGAKTSLPSMPGRIMASYWPSSAEEWSGKYIHDANARCEYQWIKTSAQSRYADGEAPVDDSNVNWDNIRPFNNSYWGGDGNYSIANVDNGVTVTYEKTGAWECVGTYLGAEATGAELVSVTLKNNGATESAIKVDAQGETAVGNHNAINVAASSKTIDVVTTDLAWGGSKFSLEPNQEAQVLIQIDQTTTRGALTNLAFFIDSLQGNEKAHAGGSVTIKDIKLAKLDGTPVEPEEQGGGDTPDKYDWSSVQPSYFQIDAWSSAYSVAHDQANFTETVTYSATENWNCVGGYIKELAANKNTLKVTLTNNSSVQADVRIDVQAKVDPNDDSTANTVNIGAYAEGHEIANNSTLTLAGNETVDFYIAYKATATTGDVINLVVFLDSLPDSNKAHTDGSVSLKNFKFADLSGGQGGDDTPDEPVIPTEFDQNAVALNFHDTAYDMEPAAGTATKYVVLSYTDLPGNGYANVEAPVTGLTGTETSFSVTIKNYGKSSAFVRVDTQGANDLPVVEEGDYVTPHTAAINTGATAAGHTDINTDTNWGGSTITLVAGEEVTFVVSFDQTTSRGALTKVVFFVDSCKYDDSTTHTGRVMFSDFIFA